jgi:hypothetical protein
MLAALVLKVVEPLLPPREHFSALAKVFLHIFDRRPSNHPTLPGIVVGLQSEENDVEDEADCQVTKTPSEIGGAMLRLEPVWAYHLLELVVDWAY